MNLAIDIGNSRTKWARFSEKKIVESGLIPDSGIGPLQALMAFHSEDSITISSVIALDEGILGFANDRNALFIDHSTPIPIKNNYGTPSTLGMDRLCAAIGAHALFPNFPVLSIDIGTCIKYEFITEKGEYQGGNISPGMQMRFSSLHANTAKLPALTPEKVAGPIGNSTQEALRLGVQQGMLFEIETMISTMQTLHPTLKTVGTGGDLPFFVNDLKTHIFADLLLVLRGINEIYLHNT